jgi:hypothetical protein
MDLDYTAGYDLVGEFPFAATDEIDLLSQAEVDPKRLSQIFHANDLITEVKKFLLQEDMNSIISAGIKFSLHHPVDSIQYGENPLDIQIEIGFNLFKVQHRYNLRMVVGVVVDHPNLPVDNNDHLLIDFSKKLYYKKCTRDSQPMPDVEKKLGNLPAITVLKLPVERGTTDPTKVKRFDFRIIDDTPNDNRVCMAAMFSFGGSPTGSPDKLQSYLGPKKGTALICFDWLCRMILPLVATKLGLEADSFALTLIDCTLKSPKSLKNNEQDVNLTVFNIKFTPYTIIIEAKLEKPQSVFVVSAEFRARWHVSVQDGRLIESFKIDDPVININLQPLPWYAYFALLNVWVLLALGILYLALKFVNIELDDLLNKIAKDVNEILPTINIPAFGLDLFLDEIAFLP